jgi:catechol 2,3-dioxygenase
MPKTPNAQLTHVGLFVDDLDRMVAFYTGLIGMVVSDAGTFLGKQLTFLTRSVHEHHQLVLIKGRSAEPGTKLLSQISFRVDDLDDLRHFARTSVELGATELEARNHGNSWSIYFRDPEYNPVEMYAPTPWQVRQPWRVALDLRLTNEQIEQATLQLIVEADVMIPLADWQQQMDERLNRRPTGDGS